MQYIKPTHSLLIIGNGFDLNCQIKSSFSDFIETVERDSNIWYLLFRFAFPSEFYEGNHFIEAIRVDDILWKDVESLIKRVLFLSIFDKKKSETTRLEKFFSVSNYVELLKTIYSNRFNSQFHYSDEQIVLLKNYFTVKFPAGPRRPLLNILDFLYKELLAFENDFQKYIEHISENNVYRAKSIQLFNLLQEKNAEIYDVLSFNYTFPKYSGNYSFQCYSFNYIHGSIDEKIIIGYDSSDLDIEIGKELQLSKIYQKLMSNLKSFSLPNKDEVSCIKIYGHSLGSQDYSYFHSIFDYYDIANNKNISLNFCYTPFKATSAENEKIKEEYISNVYKLLNKYSSLRNNAESIDTLTNRLLLENRLHIRTIDSLSDKGETK